MLRVAAVLTTAVLFLPACSASGVGERAPDSAAWSLKGWRVIGCCCSAPCACRINKKPSFCHGCDHTDLVHVEDGELGGVAMDGVSWVVVGRGFGAEKGANWAYVYVDERISDAQFDALGKWLSAGVEGLKARAPYLAGEFRGMRKVPMQTVVTGDEREYGVTIPGILELSTRAIVNPGHSEPVVSTGIMDAFGDRFVHADALRHSYHDHEVGAEWDLAGRQANFAEFTLDAARAARGGIGWGCWSAHGDFGDGAPYGEEFTAQHAGHH